MEYMFKDGFLNTHAPLYMDEVTTIVALLPFLVMFAISFAKKGMYNIHAIMQIIIYIVGILFVGYFEYGVRVQGGFEELLKESTLDHNFMYIFLAFHVFIAIISTIYWTITIAHGVKNFTNMMEIGFRKKHRSLVKKAYLGIVLTSLTGVMLYMFLFVV